MKRQLVAFLVICISSLLCAFQHPTGVLQPLPETLEKFSEYSLPKRILAQDDVRSAAPESHVNIAHLPKVWSQGGLGICGSFAPTYYLGNYYLSMRDGAGRYDRASDASKMISPMWSVHMFRHGDGRTQPNGGDTLDSIRGLCEQGYLTLAEMPFDGAPLPAYHLPNAKTQRTALTRRLNGYGVTLSGISTPEGLERLKAALRNGDIFVVTTAPIPLNFDQYPMSNAALGEDAQSNNNNVFVWPAKGLTREPHAVTIIGYDDTKLYIDKDGEEAFGALLAVNSWGEGWGVKYNGEGGYIWLGYDSFLKHGFLDDSVYSMRPGVVGYKPSMTATVTVTAENGYERPWVDSIGRAWLHGIDFTQNGHALCNPIAANAYVTGLEGNALTAEILVDLSGYEDALLSQFGAKLSFGSAKENPGKITSVEFCGSDGKTLLKKDVDGALKPFSDSYLSCSHFISAFEDCPEAMPPVFPQTGSFAMGDLNGDGRVDAVAFVRQGKETKNAGVEFVFRAYLQKSDGSWQEKELGALFSGVADVLLVDLNGDGVLDIAASNGAKAVFLKNDGKGNFTSLASVSLGEEQNARTGLFATADFDNDGRPDFALMNQDGVMVLRQESASKYTSYPLGTRCLQAVSSERQGASFAVGDINGDGWADIVAMGLDKESWTRKYVLYQNKGDMTFTPRVLPLPAVNFGSISIADADLDGCDDILYAGGTGFDADFGEQSASVFILKGRSDVSGKFRMPVALPVDTSVEAAYGGNVAWADLDSDGRPEVLLTGTTSGATTGNSNSDPYGEDDIQYPLHKIARNYLKILRWNGAKYVDAGMELPGTVGFAGPSILDVKDFDGDGRPDIVHGGCFGYKSVVFAHQGPNRSICGMKLLRNQIDVSPTALAAPKSLAAKSLGKGQAKLTWASGNSDGAGQRFVLRIGTASGKCDVVSPENGAFYKSGAVLSHLPAKKLYWAVRAVDASGRVSAFSAEGTFTPSGSAAAPVPAASCLAEIPLPKCTVTCVSADASQGSAAAISECMCGSEITLTARANSGWRFAYWESDVQMQNRLSASAVTKIYENANFVAHFVPDDSRFQMDERHIGLLDAAGNLWFYENPAQEVPFFAAVSGCTYFTLADRTAYFDRIGGRAWNHKLLRALNGLLWFNAISAYFGDEEGMGGYMEQTQRAWGGPGGLAVRYDFEQPNVWFNRELAVIHANYSDYPPSALKDSEEIASCVVQKNFMLILTSAGRVRFIGLNDCGQFGGAAPFRLREATEITSLPEVTTIAAGTSFVAAIDTTGALWTWGDNRKGQLGRGSAGGLKPVPAKVTGLTSKVVAIAAGESHLAALCEDGTLHLWGDNAFGQLGATNGIPLPSKRITAVAAAANRTAALDSDGNMYLWGDGVKAPAKIDNVSFDTVHCRIKADARVKSLLSVGLGNRVARANIPISIQADSAEKAVFQHWIVNDVRHDENPLKITMTEGAVIEAVYQLTKPLVSFGEPEIGDTEIAVDVILSQTDQKYDGVYFAITHSADMPVTELKFTWPTPRGIIRFDTEKASEDHVTTEFYIHNNSMLFRTSDPMFKMVFAKPQKGSQAFAEWTVPPVLARNLGEASDEADTDDGLHLSFDNQDDASDEEVVEACVVNVPEAGRFGYLCIPGDAGVQTLAELEDLLGVEGLRAWSWDGAKMTPIAEVQPYETMVFTVASRNSDGARIYYQPTAAAELRPGWNLVMLPKETTLPQSVYGSYMIDCVRGSFLQHYGKLQPGMPYWLYVKE